MKKSFKPFQNQYPLNSQKNVPTFLQGVPKGISIPPTDPANNNLNNLNNFNGQDQFGHQNPYNRILQNYENIPSQEDPLNIVNSKNVKESIMIKEENDPDSLAIKVYCKIDLNIKKKDFYKYLISQQKSNDSDQQRYKKELPKEYKDDCEKIIRKLKPNGNVDLKSQLFQSVVIIPLKVKIIKENGQNTIKPLSLPIVCRNCHHCEVMDFDNLFPISQFASKTQPANENENSMQNIDVDDESIINPNPNILVKCTICNQETDISKLYVEERLYRLLKFIDPSKCPELQLLAIPKERFGTFFTTEDIIRYDKRDSHSLTNKKNLDLRTFSCKADIYEVGQLEYQDKQFISITLHGRNKTNDSNEIQTNITHRKDNRMPKFWITINSFLTGNSLDDLLNSNALFDQNYFKILLTDLKRFKIACNKLSSNSVEPIMIAFSMACSIVLGYSTFCLIDEINLSEFIVIYSFLKRIINLQDYDYNLIIISKNKEKIEADTKEEPYCSFLKVVTSPYKIILNHPNSSNEVIVSQMKFLLDNIIQNIESDKTYASTPFENIEQYFHYRISSLKCFEHILGDPNNEFNLRNISFEQDNFRIIFKTNDSSKSTKKNSTFYHAFKASSFPLIFSLEADYLKEYDGVNSIGSSPKSSQIQPDQKPNQPYKNLDSNNNFNRQYQQHQEQYQDINKQNRNVNQNKNQIQNWKNQYFIQGNQNYPQTVRGQGCNPDQIMGMQNSNQQESAPIEVAKNQMNTSSSFVFYLRFSYEFLERLEKGTLLFLTDEQISTTLKYIRNKNNEEFIFFTCNILSTIYKKYLKTDEKNSEENNLPQEVERQNKNVLCDNPYDIILSTLFCLCSGAIVNLSNIDSSKLLLKLLINKKCSYPKFSSIPLFILIEDSLDSELLSKLKVDENGSNQDPSSNIMNKEKRTPYENYNTNYEKAINENIQEFFNKNYGITAHLNFIYFNINVELENGTTKIRIFCDRRLNIYLAFYSSERKLDTILKALQVFFSRKEIQIKNSRVTEKLKIAVENSLESLPGILKDNTSEYLVSALKLNEDYVFGVKYEMRIETLNK